MPGRLVIVCGLPGAGKTTLAKRIEAAYGGARLSPDDRLAELGVDLFESGVRGSIERLQWQLAQRLLDIGVTVIIEWGTWGRDERDALREGARARGAAVELRFLDPPLDVLWQRIHERDLERQLGSRALTRADLDEYAALLQRPDADELALFDPPLPT